MRLPRTAMALMAAFVLAIAFPIAPATAQSQAEFDVPAGRLSSSIRIAARQAGISIASRDAGVRRVRAKAVRGRMSTREALRQLLSGTPFRAVAVRGGYRIERRPVRRASARPAPSPQAAPVAIAPRRPSAPPPPPPPPIPIVVEGTKRSQTALDYPGGVTVLRLDDPAGLGGEYPAGAALDEVLSQVPSVNGTALGSGRNKVFLRGIADSSFNGPTQSTIGMYLGEQKLVFSAPNPDLRLYDVESVELLEGPQGTLYGAGTIAGLLRINPRAPDPSAMSAEGWGSLGATKGGGTNWTLGAVGNVPISGASAVRVLAYSGKETGYLDDPSRDLSGMNDSFHLGGRAALYAELGPDWSVELSGFGQHNELRDGQYIDESLDDLTRTDLAAQPFRGRIYGGGVSLRGYLGDKELVSSTSMVDHNLRSTFDSSILTDADGSRAGIQTFRESRKIRLINLETRLSGSNAAGIDWLVGISALRNRDDMRQLITNLNGSDPPPFANVTYRLDEIAAFGEATYEFAPDFSVTGGARLLYTSAAGERSFGQDTVIEPREGPARLLPAAAISWKPSQNWQTYLRYQQGFRTGGVTIERDSNKDPTSAQFDPDRIRSYEAGVRGQIGSTAPLRFGLTAYHSRWRDIQADFIDAQGFPITRNIGDGEVFGVSGNARFETTGGWRLSMAGAWNDTNVDRQLAGGGVAGVAIPNVPEISGRARIAKLWELDSEHRVGLSFSGRYLGQSFVDIDQLVRDEQGQYGSLDLAAWWASDRIEVRLDAINLTNTRGNRFAFGNPFTARTEDQATPMRPRTIQIQLNFKH